MSLFAYPAYCNCTLGEIVNRLKEGMDKLMTRIIRNKKDDDKYLKINK
jgi:hypothetical protein